MNLIRQVICLYNVRIIKLTQLIKTNTIKIIFMEKNMAIEIPGLDVDKGLDLCDGNLDIYLRILRCYVLDITAALEIINNISEENLALYAKTVHGIKGTSEAIGAEEARIMAKELEQMGKANNLSGVLEKNNAFVKYITNLLENIKAWLEKYDAAEEGKAKPK